MRYDDLKDMSQAELDSLNRKAESITVGGTVGMIVILTIVAVLVAAYMMAGGGG